MKKLINAPDAVVREALEGIEAAHAIRDEHPELRATGEQDREDLI